MDPRTYRVISVAAPTDEEKVQHYLWRFWRHVPRAGYVTLYDRSWYGRVLVERVEGFARPEEWGRSYLEITTSSSSSSPAGSCSPSSGCTSTTRSSCGASRSGRRWPEAPQDRPEDWRNREKWDRYEEAVSDMIARTSTAQAPWTLVAANDKRWPGPGRRVALRPGWRRRSAAEAAAMAHTCPWWFGYSSSSRSAGSPRARPGSSGRCRRGHGGRGARLRDGLLHPSTSCAWWAPGPGGRHRSPGEDVVWPRPARGPRRAEERSTRGWPSRPPSALDDLAGPGRFRARYYVVHELRDPAGFFAELAAALRPEGSVLVVEPPLHVSRQAFAESLRRRRGGRAFASPPGPGSAPTRRPLLVRSEATGCEEAQAVDVWGRRRETRSGGSLGVAERPEIRPRNLIRFEPA